MPDEQNQIRKVFPEYQTTPFKRGYEPSSLEDIKRVDALGEDARAFKMRMAQESQQSQQITKGQQSLFDLTNN